jgi:hypothetical protein
MTNLMDPAFAMDETFFSSRGSRLDQLRNALELTAITPRARVRGRRSFDRQSDLLPLFKDVVGQKPSPVDDLCLVGPRGLQRHVQRGGDILGLHGCAQLPGDDVAREVVEDGRQVEPAPTDDFQIGVSRPGGLHPGPSQNRT